MLRPLVGAPIGLVGGVAVLLLQLAYEAVLFAPDFLKLVIAELAPLFARTAFELFPLALDDVPVHLRPPPEGQPYPCASSPILWPFTGRRPRRRACVQRTPAAGSGRCRTGVSGSGSRTSARRPERRRGRHPVKGHE